MNNLLPLKLKTLIVLSLTTISAWRIQIESYARVILYRHCYSNDVTIEKTSNMGLIHNLAVIFKKCETKEDNEKIGKSRDFRTDKG